MPAIAGSEKSEGGEQRLKYKQGNARKQGDGRPSRGGLPQIHLTAENAEIAEKRERLSRQGNLHAFGGGADVWIVVAGFFYHLIETFIIMIGIMMEEH